MYNLYSILKTSKHNVLLVIRLHPVYVTLTFLPSVRGFEPHFLHRSFTFYDNLTKWTDGLTGGPTRSAGRSCGPRASSLAGPCRATVWASICGGLVWDVEVGCAEGTNVQRVNFLK
jgi:hypothetical protein